MEFWHTAGGWSLKSSNKFEVKELGTYELDNLFGFDKGLEDCIYIASPIWQRHMTIRLPGLTKIR